MPDRVLLIDDDPRLVTVLQIRLEASGYEVHTAYCGQEGLAVARQSRPDVIILDMSMPGMNGDEVCRIVRADADLRTMPILVISAIAHEAARQAAIEAGANQFLAKPYQPAQVLAAIRAVIDKQRTADLATRGSISLIPGAA